MPIEPESEIESESGSKSEEGSESKSESEQRNSVSKGTLAGFSVEPGVDILQCSVAPHGMPFRITAT